jgi:GAF domain-containing protein
MTAGTATKSGHLERDAALTRLAVAAVSNIPGADCASVTLRSRDGRLCTLAATDPVAEQADQLQYELREGPCYAAVTSDRFVLVNDLAAGKYPHYGPGAVGLGLLAQAAVQLLDGREHAGLNLYSRSQGAFDRSTVELAELFATQAAAMLGYVEQVEQLSEALHTRTDIGIAVGILMERYQIDRHRAFAFLARTSQNRNIKVRALALDVGHGTFEPLPVDGDMGGPGAGY